LQGEPKPITFGIISDTHIPDRVRHLSEKVLEGLQSARVDIILHAGDAASVKAIHELEEIAPVRVVQGNRDWLLGLKFPHYLTFSAFGVRITVAHGHRTMLHYLFDKWATLQQGYRFERYYQHLAQDYPHADVIIFGHTHHQTVQWVKGQLFFNPGAAYPCKYNHYHPQYGVLGITPAGTIRTACY